MLIFPLTGNRNLYTPACVFATAYQQPSHKTFYVLYYYYTRNNGKSKRISLCFFIDFKKQAKFFHPFPAIFLTEVLCSVPESKRHMFFLCAPQVNALIINKISKTAAKQALFCAP